MRWKIIKKGQSVKIPINSKQWFLVGTHLNMESDLFNYKKVEMLSNRLMCMEKVCTTFRNTDEADKDATKILIDASRRITTREIELRINVSNSLVFDHLKGLGLSSKLDVCLLHVLTNRFLKRIITGDESWVVFLTTSTARGHVEKKMNRLK